MKEKKNRPKIKSSEKPTLLMIFKLNSQNFNRWIVVPISMSLIVFKKQNTDKFNHICSRFRPDKILEMQCIFFMIDHFVVIVGTCRC